MPAALTIFNSWTLDFTQIGAAVTFTLGGITSRGGTGVQGRSLDADASPSPNSQSLIVIFNSWTLDFTQIGAAVTFTLGGITSRGGTGVQGRALNEDALLRFDFVYVPPIGSANTYYFAGMMGVPVQFAGFGSPLPPSTSAPVSMQGGDAGDWKRKRRKREERRKAGQIELLEEFFEFEHGA